MGKNKEVQVKTKRKSLVSRAKLLLGASLLIFAIAFCISLLVFSIKSRRDYGIRESETVINAMSESIQGSIQSYKDISRLVMLDDDVRTYLRMEVVDDGIKYDARMGVQDVMIASDNLDSVFVFRDDYSYITTGRGDYHVDTVMLSSQEWQSKIENERGGAIVCINADGAVYRQNGDNIITIKRVINDIDTQNRVGFLLINVSTKLLEHALMEQENSEICVLTAEGNYLIGSVELASLYSPDFAKQEEISYKNIKYHNGPTLISGRKIKDLPLIVMCATNTKSSRVPIEVTIGLLIILVAFFISMFIAVMFIARDLTKPISFLSSAMENTKETGYLEKIDVHLPNNELGQLADTYNAMIEELNKSIEKQLEQEKTVQKAEMRVLHEQIKPHFLYNSLETISFMAMEAGASNVYDALETLGSFYRNFLSKGDREITVRREIKIIKDYLSLQKLRYKDIIYDEYDIAEDIMDIRIPKLILQPLVENCIYHGIRPKGEPGTIRISAKGDGDNLIITVFDSGIGMSAEMIDKVLGKEEIENNDISDSSLNGFGLKGTIDRIRYYCDKDDVVMIESEEGEYTQIVVTVPLLKE